MPEELMDESNALGLLRGEHGRIRELLASVAEEDQIDFRRQAMILLLQELDIHDAMEQKFFYPFVRERLESDLVARPLEFNQIIMDLAAKLRGLDPLHADFIPTVDELIRALDLHIFEEEEYLFTKLEGKDPYTYNELVRVALMMRELRNQMIEVNQTPRAIDATGGQPVTTGDVQQRIAQEKGRGIYPPRDVVLDDAQIDQTQGGTADFTTTTNGETIDLGARSVNLRHDPSIRSELSNSASSDEEGLIEDASHVQAQGGLDDIGDATHPMYDNPDQPGLAEDAGGSR